MSIFVWSTRETDSGRNLLAATASFSALLFAASPTISIRSGISRATFSALSPIEPVAPRITTRLRFIFWEAQAASLLFAATCRDLFVSRLITPWEIAGWQPAQAGKLPALFNNDFSAHD